MIVSSGNPYRWILSLDWMKWAALKDLSRYIALWHFLCKEIDSATADGFAMITLKDELSELNSLTINSLVSIWLSNSSSAVSTGVTPYKDLEGIPMSLKHWLIFSILRINDAQMTTFPPWEMISLTISQALINLFGISLLTNWRILLMKMLSSFDSTMGFPSSSNAPLKECLNSSGFVAACMRRIILAWRIFFR